MSSKELAEAVLNHAHTHYNDEGIRWDYIEECFTLEEVEVEIKDCSTEAEAIRRMENFARSYYEQSLNAQD